MTRKRLFDTWPEKYDLWFTTPIGRLVKESETDLILSLMGPKKGETILDAGCGTGMFALELVKREAGVVGMELSMPMLRRAAGKMAAGAFMPVQGNLEQLPFSDERFDKTMSITAIEFIEDAEAVVRELFRVTRKGGTVVVAALNGLSSWAKERRKKAESDPGSVFRQAIFRTTDEMAALASVEGDLVSAVHFSRDDTPETAARIESDPRNNGLVSGAFLAIRWIKPDRV